MRRKFFIFWINFLFMMIFSPISVHAQENETAFVLLEANTGNILQENYAEEIRPVGSLTKLMTAYLTAKAIEERKFSLDTIVTAGESVSGMRGAVVWLKTGDTISIRELLLALIAGNANDAAAVLADNISGNEQLFIMDMNAMAFDLGMKSTRFTSPQGFDDEQAYSTAHDVALLCQAVLQCPALEECLTTWRTFILENSVELVNENTFTRTMNSCQGLKAAHSSDSGYCLAAAAESNGMSCIAVILNAPDEDSRFTLAKQLLNQGFSQYQVTLSGFSEEFLQPLKIKNGTETAVLLELSFSPSFTIPVGTQLETVTVLPEFVQAPVHEHQQVGTVYFYQGKTLLGQSALLTADSVPEMTFPLAWKKLLHHLFS